MLKRTVFIFFLDIEYLLLYSSQSLISLSKGVYSLLIALVPLGGDLPTIG